MWEEIDELIIVDFEEGIELIEFNANSGKSKELTKNSESMV